MARVPTYGKKIRQFFSQFIFQIYALRKSAQSCLQLASLAQCFGEASSPTSTCARTHHGVPRPLGCIPHGGVSHRHCPEPRQGRHGAYGPGQSQREASGPLQGDGERERGATHRLPHQHAVHRHRPPQLESPIGHMARGRPHQEKYEQQRLARSLHRDSIERDPHLRREGAGPQGQD